VVVDDVAVEVVRQSDVLVGRFGGCVVGVVTHVSPVADRAVALVEVDELENGRREQPPKTAARARATSARISARLKKGRKTRFIG
jgi:hypothetical protein